MPRFVILEHDHPTRHWDFMLEFGDSLRTWRLADAPTPNRVIAAEPIANHRLAYLDYEGPVSGDRGSVSRWDSGTYEWLKSDLESIVISLQSRVVRGNVELAKDHADNWTFVLRTGELGGR